MIDTTEHAAFVLRENRGAPSGRLAVMPLTSIRNSSRSRSVANCGHVHRVYPTVKYALGHGKACVRVVVGGTPVTFDHGRISTPTSVAVRTA